MNANHVAIDGTYRVFCMNCGKSVSNAMPIDIIVRAWVICPECVEKYGTGGDIMKDEIKKDFNIQVED